MKACVITYGCRQNVSDGEKLSFALEDLGYDIIEDVQAADLVIFNTCSVREGAEERVYGNIGALKPIKKMRPNMKIAVCGCMATRAEVQDRIKKSFPYVNLVFGTNDYHRLGELLESADKKRVFEQNEDIKVHEIKAKNTKGPIANVPIMYGCNNFCSYCIVPYVRGGERSRDWEAIANEVRELSREGKKEILLLGQNVNSYRSDITFPQLLEKMAEIDGIERIRFISSHPKDFSDELIDVMEKNDKVCKALHLPFQAGSNRVLKDMNRKYSREHYISLIEKARAAMPNLVITSDVIVGFPTERQEDFEETLDLVKTLKLDSLFTFIYSKRSGTPAADMKFEQSAEQIKTNFQKLLAVQEKISSEINERLLGTTQEVLVEGRSTKDENMWTGRSGGGKIVNFVGDENIKIGDMVRVFIESTSPWALSGRA